MRNIVKVFLLVALALAVLYFAPSKQEPEVTPEGQENPEVIIDTPTWGQLVTSPMQVSGKARGTWYFEANLPARLEDQDGKILAQKGFQAKGDPEPPTSSGYGAGWMTEEYVPFEDVLEFTQPETEFGRLIIEKDNPSGLPEHDASFAIPVKFR